MANLISQVKLPNNTTYTIRDPNARPLSNNDFDTINVTELNAGDLIVTGVGRFTNGLYGDLNGTATQVSNNLKIQLNSGTTEGTNQFTYNGSSAKTVNITKSGIGLGNVENKSSATIRGELTSSNVTTALGYTPLNSNLKGASNGLAELDANGLVPSSQLPSYVDDVLEYSSKSAFPTTGETGKIYVATDTNLTYRWGGSAYTEISPSLALGETSSTAYRGDRGVTAYSHATDSSRLTTATASGLYKVASTAQGHIASLTAVTKADITGLGIPGSDTNTHRPIQVNGTEILGNNTTALNLKAGTNVSLSNSSGTVTIASTDTNTTYSLSASGESVVLSGSDNSSKSVSLSTLINGLSTGGSDPTDNDYFISQYVNGGTTTTQYYRRPMSCLWNYVNTKASGVYVAKSDIPTVLGTKSYGGSGDNRNKKIKIKINPTNLWMLCFTVTLYQNYKSTKVMISGYNYDAYHWHAPNAKILGSSETTAFNVYFGYDANKELWVGFDADLYTAVTVDSVTNGYQQISDYKDMFTISIVDELTTLQTTQTIYRPWYRDETVANATKATQDGSGNVIASTYVKLSGDTLNNGAQIVAKTNDTSSSQHYNGGIQLREYNGGGSTLEETLYNAPGISFHWSSRYAGKLSLYKGGHLYFQDKPLGTFTQTEPTSGQVVITDGVNGGIKSSGYTIATSVPAGASFTDKYVSQSVTTTSDYRKIVLSYQNGSAGAAVTDQTNVVYVTANAEVQPSTGNIRSAGTISAANLSATTNVNGVSFGVATTSGTTGGISLYNGAGYVTSYGLAMRTTSNGGKHGYVQGDWGTYFYMAGATNRGWVFVNAGSGNRASISTEGNMVLNGSLTLGGNTTNTSGVRQVYDSSTKSLSFVFVA